MTSKENNSAQPNLADKAANSEKLSVSLAPFWKRLFAWVYDLLGGLAVFILAFVVGYLLIYIVSLPWASDGQSVSKALTNNPLWAIYLLLCVQYYYAWCWVKGGQTVGMRAWRLKVCKPDGAHLSWKEAYIRTIASLGGLSTCWSILDKEKRGIQDIIVDSRVVLLPKSYQKQDKPLI